MAIVTKKPRKAIPGFGTKIGTKKFNKAGLVIAMDQKFTGEEPQWSGWEKWDLAKFFNTQDRAIRFYNYYLDPIDFQRLVVEWMKKTGYAKTEIQVIKDGPTWLIPTTAGKLIRCFNMGMPHLHPKAQEHFDATLSHLQVSEEHPAPRAQDDSKRVHQLIRQGLNMAASTREPVTTVTPVVKKSPHDRIMEKVDKHILPLLEETLDKWTADPNKIQNLNVGDVLKGHMIARNGCSAVADWIIRHKTEFEGALNKECKQLVEGYSYLTRSQLKKIVAAFQYALDSIGEYAKVKTSERKPREKKVKPPIKQVARLQFAEKSDRFGVESEPAVKIVGAAQLFVFDDKYRVLHVYQTNTRDGFTVVGSAVKGWDPDKSYTLKLRKPEEILPVVEKETAKRIEKLISALKTKRGKATGRVNKNQIILRTIK